MEQTDGDDIVFESGKAVSLSVHDWLKAGGADLDERNELVESDIYDASKKPFLRTTGVAVTLDIEYSNVPDDDGLFGAARPWPGHKEVEARVKVEADKMQWAGLGAEEVIYAVPPTGPIGRETFKKTIRYSQGVVFTFKGKGSVYDFNAVYLINAIVSGIVLLGVASAITVQIAKKCWPTRQLMQ